MKKVSFLCTTSTVLVLLIGLQSCSSSRNIRIKPNESIELYSYYKSAFLGLPGLDLVLKNKKGDSRNDTLRMTEFVTLSGERKLCFVPMAIWRYVTDSEDGVSYEFTAVPLGKQSALRNIAQQKLSVSQQMMFSAINDKEKWFILSISRKGNLVENGSGRYDFLYYKKG